MTQARLRKTLRWTAIVSFLVLFVTFALNANNSMQMSEPGSGMDRQLRTFLSLSYIAMIGSAITFLLSTAGSLLTMIFAWRSERRQSEKHQLEIEQLKRELREKTST